jgi:hypothetical protein
VIKVRLLRAAPIGALLVWVLVWGERELVSRPWEWSASTGTQPAAASFAAQVDALSERGGYFDTDNLISNERSYLEVLPDLKKRGVQGGAYVGVGPDQNFSYIGAIRPDIAIIIDIRRDNLLLHLLFKSLFALARTRVEYLSLLFGRAVPSNLDPWRSAPTDRLVAHLDGAALDAKGIAALRARVDEAVTKIGVALTAQERATIDRFHRRFIDAGLELRFQSLGRPPQMHYPTYRDLMLERVPGGDEGSYLASEDAFLYIKDLQRRDLVVPVVGDLSGPSAMAAVGKLLTARGQRVSAVYTSNVEFYLFNDGRFPAFVTNLGRLPRSPNSVIIRSFFQRYAWPGSVSASRLQGMGELVEGFAKGKFRYYGELMQ